MNQVVSTREFLRNFKSLKEKLRRGEFTEIHVVERDGSTLRVIDDSEQTPAERFIEKIKRKSFKGLKRPEEDLF